MKKTIEEVRDWLLRNREDVYGNLNLKGLDFSKFDGDIIINGMKVKKSLHQIFQEVEKNSYQSNCKVNGDLFQQTQRVARNLFQFSQKVEGVLHQSRQKVKENLFQNRQEVKGDISQFSKKIERNSWGDYM